LRSPTPWAKYGPALSEHAAFSIPRRSSLPQSMSFRLGIRRPSQQSRTTLDTLIGHGVRFAVCMLPRGIAGQAAR
jgi:hypothetical protein